MKKQLRWLDNHLLEIIAGFLLAFLPLYPKWPLFDVLPGYIVRVRLEDFLIALALLIFGLWVKRGKASLRQNPLLKPIMLYWLIGFLSALSAIFLTQSVPLETPHVAKLFLHWARRVEYMSLAFIFFAAVGSKAQLKRVLTVFVITALAISLYGFGQKYLEWPVYTTMNREFAKGWRLVLTEHARVNSTFAGHYDLAGFTVIALPILAALFVFARKRAKVVYALIFLLLFSMLLLTASRTSFIAYVGSITILCGLLVLKVGWRRAAATYLAIMVVSVIGFKSFGSLYERFAHILMLDRVEILLSSTFDRLKPSGSSQPSLTLSNDLKLVYNETDTPPSPAPGTTLPPDVYEAIPLNFPEASLSGIPSTSGTGTEGQDRTYSDSAYRYGLSSAIRFDALWPRALAGFKANPLLGSGYSTLTKVQTSDFTEAESTDNDYLRALGETGLLGLGSFVAILFYALYRALKSYLRSQDSLTSAFLVAFIALTLGLMVNALYIDIFVASKVAYMFWALTGVAFAAIVKLTPKPAATKTK